MEILTIVSMVKRWYSIANRYEALHSRGDERNRWRCACHITESETTELALMLPIDVQGAILIELKRLLYELQTSSDAQAAKA